VYREPTHTVATWVESLEIAAEEHACVPYNDWSTPSAAGRQRCDGLSHDGMAPAAQRNFDGAQKACAVDQALGDPMTMQCLPGGRQAADDGGYSGDAAHNSSEVQRYLGCFSKVHWTEQCLDQLLYLRTADCCAGTEHLACMHTWATSEWPEHPPAQEPHNCKNGFSPAGLGSESEHAHCGSAHTQGGFLHSTTVWQLREHCAPSEVLRHETRRGNDHVLCHDVSPTILEPATLPRSKHCCVETASSQKSSQNSPRQRVILGERRGNTAPSLIYPACPPTAVSSSACVAASGEYLEHMHVGHKRPALHPHHSPPDANGSSEPSGSARVVQLVQKSRQLLSQRTGGAVFGAMGTSGEKQPKLRSVNLSQH
jgi:hypothetical protein